MNTKVCYCKTCRKNTVWKKFGYNFFYKEKPNIEYYQCTACGVVKEYDKNA